MAAAAVLAGFFVAVLVVAVLVAVVLVATVRFAMPDSAATVRALIFFAGALAVLAGDVFAPEVATGPRRAGRDR